MTELIDPRQLIQEISLSALCDTAEEYYQKVPDPHFQMSKPFASILEAPELLYKMGLLLAGLRLGTSMVVLDFGAGPCWFSRFLNQMRCSTVSVDVSATALEMGKRLFAEMPILGNYVEAPQFVQFDGEHIDIPDESVDRIISFDAFHHVPNQKQVLSEFYRVLRPGGIVGFSEPGRHHSQQPQSQYEMKHYQVLENDIHLDEIMEVAQEIGFGDLRIKFVQNIHEDLTYEDYKRITSQWFLQPIRLLKSSTEALRHTTMFFFTKGTYMPDSRNHIGLLHQLQVKSSTNRVKLGDSLDLKVAVTNVGVSKWLHQNVYEIGRVKVGVHLYSADRKPINLDFARATFSEDVLPGQSVSLPISLVLPHTGTYVLGFDLVSEHLGWFENWGSTPIYLTVEVVERE